MIPDPSAKTRDGATKLPPGLTMPGRDIAQAAAVIAEARAAKVARRQDAATAGAQGDYVEPFTAAEQAQRYVDQNGSRRLTPAQRRRVQKSINRGRIQR